MMRKGIRHGSKARGLEKTPSMHILDYFKPSKPLQDPWKIMFYYSPSGSIPTSIQPVKAVRWKTES